MEDNAGDGRLAAPSKVSDMSKHHSDADSSPAKSHQE
jgi:hypothetical protein